MSSLYEFEVKTLDGKTTTMGEFKGKVLLIVNTASLCGFTPQYEGLQKLYRKYQERGLVVLGFPCDQFGHQEPGGAGEIADFCTTRFSITFPLFEKIDVNGSNAHPLYVYLKENKSGLLGTEAIKWNFTKFLVNRQGEVVNRYAPTTTPESLEKDIEALL
jgi:glutathione peroxidase